MGGCVKRWKDLGTKSAQHAANGPVWMPQGQKPLCLIHFLRIPFSHFQPLLLPSFLPLSGVIRNGLVIMGGRVKRWKCFGTKSVWQAPNGPVWMHQGKKKPVSHSLLYFPIFSPCSFLSSFLPLSGVIRNGLLWDAGKRWTFFGTKSVWQAANGPVWMPRGLKPLCLIHFWRVQRLDGINDRDATIAIDHIFTLACEKCFKRFYKIKY